MTLDRDGKVNTSDRERFLRMSDDGPGGKWLRKIPNVMFTGKRQSIPFTLVVTKYHVLSPFRENNLKHSPYYISRLLTRVA